MQTQEPREDLKPTSVKVGLVAFAAQHSAKMESRNRERLTRCVLKNIDFAAVRPGRVAPLAI